MSGRAFGEKKLVEIAKGMLWDTLKENPARTPNEFQYFFIFFLEYFLMQLLEEYVKELVN